MELSTFTPYFKGGGKQVEMSNSITAWRYSWAFKKKAIIQRWFLDPKEVLKFDSFIEIVVLVYNMQIYKVLNSKISGLARVFSLFLRLSTV